MRWISVFFWVRPYVFLSSILDYLRNGSLNCRSIEVRNVTEESGKWLNFLNGTLSVIFQELV